MATDFGPVRLGECDSCCHMQKLNEFSLCECCDAEGHAFKIAAGNAKSDGETPHEQYMAGKKAVKKVFIPQPVYAPHNPATLIALGKDD